MGLVLLWVGLAIVVGVAANTRGRSGFGWFLLAVLISPLISGLLVLALPRVQEVPDVQISHAPHTEPSQPIISSEEDDSNREAFVPDGVFAGVPYKAIRGGAVIAMLPGGLVHFRSMELFVAAATGGNAR
jgi:hypothetical protein